MRNYPNWCRLMIVLVCSTLGYHTLSLLSAMCFFGEIVWVLTNSETDFFMWQLALFAFCITILMMVFKLVVVCVREWEARNVERRRVQGRARQRERIRLQEFIRMAEDGNLP